MSATERLFVAQELPGPFREHLRAQFQLPDPWRMTPLENLHLTLFFAGTMPQDAWHERTDALAGLAADHVPFTLDQGSLHVVEGRDHMTWLRFAPHPAFDALHEALAAAFGLPPDPRHPHWPHITLARCRHGGSLPGATEDLPRTLRVDTLTLFRSEPGSGHPRYVPLARFPLQKSSS